MEKATYSQPWYVYIAECKDKTYYTGIALNVEKRIEEHNKTNKCRYTRFRKPLKLKYKEFCDNYSEARKKECKIKDYSRKRRKEVLMKSE